MRRCCDRKRPAASATSVGCGAAAAPSSAAALAAAALVGGCACACRGRRRGPKPPAPPTPLLPPMPRVAPAPPSSLLPPVAVPPSALPASPAPPPLAAAAPFDCRRRNGQAGRSASGSAQHQLLRQRSADRCWHSKSGSGNLWSCDKTVVECQAGLMQRYARCCTMEAACECFNATWR